MQKELILFFVCPLSPLLGASLRLVPKTVEIYDFVR